MRHRRAIVARAHKAGLHRRPAKAPPSAPGPAERFAELYRLLGRIIEGEAQLAELNTASPTSA